MVATVLGLILQPISDIIGKVITDKAAAAAAQAQLQTLAAQGQLTEQITQLTALTSAQSDINKVEAASTSLFVAGWRPAVGWVCVTALGYNYVIAPLGTWFATLVGHPVPMPTLDINSLMPLLFGMLGMGTLRTVEKVKGVQANH